MRRLFSILGVLACIASATGCASMQFEKQLPWLDSGPTDLRPTRMIATWTETVYSEAGRPPVRGFGSRMYFFNRQDEPIPVDGQLVVYAYDDSKADSQTNVPDWKFAFTPEQLKNHQIPSELGPSYNVWLPFDAVGGFERKITMYPFLTSDNGDMVRGQPTSVVLPGKKVLSEEQRRGFYVPQTSLDPTAETGELQEKGTIRQATYEAGERPKSGFPEDPRRGLSRRSGLKTTTIQVPRSLAERLSTPLNVQTYQYPGPSAPPRFGETISALPQSGASGAMPAASPQLDLRGMLPQINRAGPATQTAVGPTWGSPMNGHNASAPARDTAAWPQNALGANAPTASPQNQQNQPAPSQPLGPSARFARPQFRAPAWPAAAQGPYRAATQPPLAGSPSAPASAPGSRPARGLE